jgi:uncharacterized protein (UPF0332 family)
MTHTVWLDKAERCLAAAELLLGSGDADSACNRAYYAMFNAARASLIAVGEEQRSRSKTHAALISAFGQFVVNAGYVSPELARALGKEANRRLIVDYNCIEQTVENGHQSLSTAKVFVAAIKEWINHYPPNVSS